MNSKQKGSAFERKMCRELSLWISGGRQDDLLWRSSMSGGTATVGKRKGIKKANMCGDISAIGEQGHTLTNAVIIECKAYKKFQWENFLYNNKGDIAGFWEVLIADCKTYNKQPFLILKQNAKPIVVGLNKALKCKPFAKIHNIHFYQMDKLLKLAFADFLKEYARD